LLTVRPASCHWSSAGAGSPTDGRNIM
jgi:hypothetical protein